LSISSFLFCKNKKKSSDRGYQIVLPIIEQWAKKKYDVFNIANKLITSLYTPNNMHISWNFIYLKRFYKENKDSKKYSKKFMQSLEKTFLFFEDNYTITNYNDTEFNTALDTIFDEYGLDNVSMFQFPELFFITDTSTKYTKERIEQILYEQIDKFLKYKLYIVLGINLATVYKNLDVFVDYPNRYTVDGIQLFNEMLQYIKSKTSSSIFNLIILSRQAFKYPNTKQVYRKLYAENKIPIIAQKEKEFLQTIRYKKYDNIYNKYYTLRQLKHKLYNEKYNPSLIDIINLLNAPFYPGFDYFNLDDIVELLNKRKDKFLESFNKYSLDEIPKTLFPYPYDPVLSANMEYIYNEAYLTQDYSLESGREAVHKNSLLFILMFLYYYRVNKESLPVLLYYYKTSLFKYTRNGDIKFEFDMVYNIFLKELDNMPLLGIYGPNKIDA